MIPRGSESQLEYAIDVASPFGDVHHFRQGPSFPFPQREQPVYLPDPLPAPIENPIPPVTTLPPTVPGNLPLPPVQSPPAQLPIPEVSIQAEQVLWSPESGLPVGYSAYRLFASSGSGGLIAAVDVRVNGSLHQTWAHLDDDGNIDPTPRGLANGLGLADSHLNIPENGLTMPLTEDIGEIADGMGLGTHLGGAWGVPLEIQSSTEQIAYLVVPDGVEFGDLDINIDLAVRQGDAFFQFMDLKGHGYNYKPTIEPPALPTPEIPPLVDPSQQPPLAIDPPPMTEFPPVGEEPPGDGGEIAIDDPVTPAPIFVPEIYFEYYPIYNPDDLDGDFVHGGGLAYFSLLHYLTDNDGMAELTVTGNGLNLTPRSGGRGSFVVLRNFVAQNAVLFATDTLAGQSASVPSAPEPTSAVLVLLGSCLAACRAGRRRR